ncbi:hypothetical protein HYV84_05825 [Candidatus Woesearchaeota archaeon]|nr:hypothetical protein [Candidatus Woesearchaeota archaeon]
MNRPREFLEGFEEFRKLHQPKDVAFWVIPSSSGIFESAAAKVLADIDYPLSSANRFKYMPPKGASHHLSEKEEIPKVDDPSRPFVVIDDTLDGGKTLDLAVQRLIGQGVPRDNIWFLVGEIRQMSVYDGPFLDRESVYGAFLAELSGKK